MDHLCRRRTRSPGSLHDPPRAGPPPAGDGGRLAPRRHRCGGCRRRWWRDPDRGGRLPPLRWQPPGAGRTLLVETIGSDRVKPEHVVAIHEQGAASWEAVAVRVAEVMPMAGAVVLLRDGATVAFCAASSRMGSAWWPRDSSLDPNGPLARGSESHGRPPGPSSTASGSDTPVDVLRHPSGPRRAGDRGAQRQTQ